MGPGSDRRVQGMLPAALGLRPFVPCSDFARSQAFYRTIGFSVREVNERIAVVGADDGHGPAFLLQNYYVKAYAENLMLQLVVPDVRAWWAHLSALPVWEQFGVKEPRPPRLEAWGGEVAHFWDPTGVLWHVTSLPGVTDD